MAPDFRITGVSCWAVVLLCLQLTHAFYIPGWSIRSYADGQSIPLFVNKIYSDNTEIQYAYSELPFVCPPSGRTRSATGLISGTNVALNLGEVLRGDRIVVSDYELEMGKDEEMRYLCAKEVDKAGLRKAMEVVRKGYVAEWIVDNLPGATSFVSVDKTRKYYASGFKMGYEDTSIVTGQPRYFLNNHVTIVIRYRQAPGKDGQKGKKVVVGFEVYAKSIQAENRDAKGLPIDVHHVHHGLELTLARNTTNTTTTTDLERAQLLTDVDAWDDDATLIIPYTYSVYFREETKIQWANRWDLYFVNQEDSTQIHWLAIVNSLVIAAVLSAVVLVILTRTIRSDLKSLEDGNKSRGNSKAPRVPFVPEKAPSGSGLLDPISSPSIEEPTALLSDDEFEDTAGWKLVHADVFRAPGHGHLLAPLVGSGLQLFCTSTGLVALSCLGVLNPSWRGGFVSAGFALFLASGAASGYVSGRAYRTFGGNDWRRNAAVTAALFPGLLFATVFLLNLFVWTQASSTALPLGTLLGLVALWFGVQLPLVYLGSYVGFVRAGQVAHPIRAAGTPRTVPPQAWYGKATQAVLLAGLVPFAVIFIELLFVFRSMWQDKSGYYYMFGFLAVVSVVTILAVMETTIIAIYIQLCSENYHWWWQSFFLGGSSSIWIFVYCVYYYLFHLHITGVVSTILFFAYSFLACLVYGLLTGTIGFLTAYAFVRRIYGAIKID